MLQRLAERKEWTFFGVLPKADAGLAAAWWTVLLLRGMLPAGFAIAMGVLVGAVQRGHSLAGPLAFAGAIFVLLQVLSPIHQAISANLGDRTAAKAMGRRAKEVFHNEAGATDRCVAAIRALLGAESGREQER